MAALATVLLSTAFNVAPLTPPRVAAPGRAAAAPEMMAFSGMDLTGKTAFVAGVADSTGYGWAIAKALAEAGATVTVGTWPPVLAIFEKSLKAVRCARRCDSPAIPR